MREDSQQTFSVLVNPAQSGQTVTGCLIEASQLTSKVLKKAMSNGAVWLARDGQRQRCRRNKTLKAGDELVFHYSPDLLDAEPPVLTMVHTTTDFSVWVKPRNMTISGSRFCDHTSLKRCIETQHPDQPTVYVVHRLDRFTSGLIMVAHNKTSAGQLSLLFQNRDITKRYHALIEGQFAEAKRIDLALDDKPAVSLVKPVVFKETQSIVEIEIETGRKHQIRRHLASIDHPVIGDRQHNSRTNSQSLDLQLTATYLAFEHSGQAYEFKLSWVDFLVSP